MQMFSVLLSILRALFSSKQNDSTCVCIDGLVLVIKMVYNWFSRILTLFGDRIVKLI